MYIRACNYNAKQNVWNAIKVYSTHVTNLFYFSNVIGRTNGYNIYIYTVLLFVLMNRLRWAFIMVLRLRVKKKTENEVVNIDKYI